MNATKLWAEWGATTRYLQSARIAFERERQFWTLVELNGSTQLRGQLPGGGVYDVRLEEHLEALTPWRLCASVLIMRYALAESAVADALGTALTGGIEGWSRTLLKKSGKTWEDVTDTTLAHVVEAAIVRNRVAHGDRTYSADCVTRMTEALGEAPPWIANQSIILNYDVLAEHEGRLKRFLRQAGFVMPPAG